MNLFFIPILLGSLASARVDTAKSCDLLKLLRIGEPFFKYQNCIPVALAAMSHDPPTITAFCECARNEIDKLELFKDQLDCTIWPDDPFWRDITLYERAAQDCLIKGKIRKPYMAVEQLNVYRIKENKDVAVEEHTADGTIKLQILPAFDKLEATVQRSSGLRFQKVTVPRNAQVGSAFLGLQPHPTAADMNNTIISISADSNNDALGFAAIKPENVYGRSLQLNDFTTTNVGADMATDTNAMFASVETLMRAIKNRKGWRPGNALAFILEYTHGANFEAVAATGKNGPVLVVHIKEQKGGDSGGSGGSGGSTNNDGNEKSEANSEKKKLGGGWIFLIILLIFGLIGGGVYAGFYYNQNRTRFTSFKQETQFKAFKDDEHYNEYDPPAQTTAI